MILFYMWEFKKMAEELRRLAFVSEGFFETGRYSNGELHLSVSGARAAGEDCFVLGSIAPPDERLLVLTLLAHTLKKEGARKVVAVLPYLSYARHDKREPYKSLGAAWVGAILKAAGVDEVVTVDIHSAEDRALMPLPVASVATAELFAGILQQNDLLDAVLVAPDEGAIGRCEGVRAAAALPRGIVHFKKRRMPTGIELEGPFGEVSKRAVIVDDILDTGKTIVLASRALLRNGVKELYVAATHGVFSVRYWRKLLPLPVKTIFVTDSVPHRTDLDARVRSVPIAPLLARHIAARYAPLPTTI